MSDGASGKCTNWPCQLHAGHDGPCSSSANAKPDAVEDVTPSRDTHCRWTQDGEGGAWDTQCRHRFEFTHDLEHDDAITFCMYCGKPMDVWPYEEPPNDEA